MREDLQKKINQAIRLLQSLAPKDGSPVEVAYSGGKDSDVILQLVKESGISYRAIYKNTTIEPMGTIKHAMEVGAEMLRPKSNFFEIVKKYGFPRQNARFCCKILKEYKVLDVVVMGIRRAESKKREERYKEPTECREYNNGKNKAKAIYPILYWEDEDVKEYIESRNIKVHPLYYTQEGKLDVSRRLGCQGCPLMSKEKRVKFFKDNIGWLRLWLKAGAYYLQTHPHTEAYRLYSGDVYAWMYSELFFQNKKKFLLYDDNLFGKPNYKDELEEIFKCDLSI